MFFKFIISQLTIISQLKEKIYFLKVKNNILKENNLVNKNIRNIFVLF